jgi:cytochrome c oxidase subunit IV
MGDNKLTSATPQELAYRKKKNAQDMKMQLIAFAFTIFLTIIAFVAIGYEAFSPSFSVPFILLLAVVQLLFQLYYFMHMSHKGHELPSLFLYSGVAVAGITILTFLTIIWW